VKFCVYGARAIGGYLAVELALAGHEICVVARGAHLRAIQENGLKLLIQGREKTARLTAESDPTNFGPQDFVICALKAHQAYDSARTFAPLLGPATCEIVAPGIIAHHQFSRFIIGEPNGSRSERVLSLSRALIEAGFDAPVRDDIRWNVWLKLWGKLCFNPISVLTGATLDRIVHEPSLRALCESMILETKSVNESLGIHIPMSMMNRRLEAAGSVVGHKMSMLQDLERGRSLEIDALVTAVQELGQLSCVATPIIDAVLALVKERGRRAGLYAPIGGT
jgi:2-dehydropantoate 2-reductase